MILCYTLAVNGTKYQAKIGDEGAQACYFSSFGLGTCMVHVDLNPIRAKLAPTPETYDFTSIKKDIDHAKQGKQLKSLPRFAGSLKIAKNDDEQTASAGWLSETHALNSRIFLLLYSQRVVVYDNPVLVQRYAWTLKN